MRAEKKSKEVPQEEDTTMIEPKKEENSGIQSSQVCNRVIFTNNFKLLN